MDAIETAEMPEIETPESGEETEIEQPEIEAGEESDEQEETGDSDDEGKEPEKPIYQKKLKIDGEEKEITVKTDADLDKLIQKGLGADKMFQQAAEARKEIAATKQEFTALVERWQDNILNVFDDLGADPIEFSKKVVSALENYEQLNPEQRRIMELEQEQARRQMDDERQKKTAEEQAKAAEQQEIMKEYETIVQQMKDGLRTAKLPADNKALARVAAYMQANKTATVEEAIEMYRIENEYRNKQKPQPKAPEADQDYGEIKNKPRKDQPKKTELKDSDVQDAIRRSFLESYK